MRDYGISICYGITLPPPPVFWGKNEVSVLIMAFNAQQTLFTCVQSALASTYPYIKIYILDDASTDDTFGVAESLAKQDKRVCVFRHETNQGCGVGRQFLLDQISSEFFLFLDADDTIAEDAIEHLLYLMDDRTDVVMSNVVFVYGGNRVKMLRQHSSSRVVASLSQREILQSRPLLVGKLFRLSFLREHQIVCPSFRSFEDVIMWYTMIHFRPRVKFVPMIAYHYVCRRGSVSHTMDRQKFSSRLQALRYLFDSCVFSSSLSPDPLLTMYAFVRVGKALEIALSEKYKGQGRAECVREGFVFLQTLIGEAVGRGLLPTAKAFYAFPFPFVAGVFFRLYRLWAFSDRLSPRGALALVLSVGWVYRTGRVVLRIRRFQ